MVQPSDTSSLAPNPSQVQPSLDRASDGPRSLLFGTIRNKIIVPFLFVTLVVTMLGTYIVTRLLATNAQDRLTNQLLEVSRATSDNMVKWEQNHLETLRLRHCPKFGYLQAAMGRAYTDIDFAAYRSQTKQIQELLTSLGYSENREV